MTYSGRDYEALVDEGQAAVLAQTGYQWRLGDLAVEVVGPAGTAAENEGRSGDLKQFAVDIGVEYDRLASYRVVASAWKFDARQTSVPWVNYRTIYKAEDREETMASFVGKYDGSTKDKKPSYRNFQHHLGKEATREYSKANTQETAQQALGDLEPAAQSEVIVPVLSQEPVVHEVMKQPEVRQAVVREQVKIHDHDFGHDPLPVPPLSVQVEVGTALSLIRYELRKIYDLQQQLHGRERESVADSLDTVAGQATLVASIVRDPSSVTVTDQALQDLLAAG